MCSIDLSGLLLITNLAFQIFCSVFCPFNYSIFLIMITSCGLNFFPDKLQILKCLLILFPLPITIITLNDYELIKMNGFFLNDPVYYYILLPLYVK